MNPSIGMIGSSRLSQQLTQVSLQGPNLRRYSFLVELISSCLFYLCFGISLLPSNIFSTGTELKAVKTNHGFLCNWNTWRYMRLQKNTDLIFASPKHAANSLLSMSQLHSVSASIQPDTFRLGENPLPEFEIITVQRYQI